MKFDIGMCMHDTSLIDESQKGTIIIRLFSCDNQKGTIAIDFVQW